MMQKMIQLCRDLDEENNDNSNPSAQFLFEDEVFENIDDIKEQPLIVEQRYGPRKQLTRYRKVLGINSSLGDANFEKIIYLKREKKLKKMYSGRRYLRTRNCLRRSQK